MKIAIVTQLSKSIEVRSILQELNSLGHEGKVINIRDLILEIGNSEESENGIFFEGENLFDYDLVLIRFIFNTVRRTRAIIKYLRANNVKVYDNSLDLNGFYINKTLDSVNLHINKIPHPYTINVMDEDDFKESCEELLSHKSSIIVKNSGHISGQSVFQLENDGEVDDFIDRIKAENKSVKSYLIQELISVKKIISVLVLDKKIIRLIEKHENSESSLKTLILKKFTNFKYYNSLEIDFKLIDKVMEVSNCSSAVIDLLISEDNKTYVIDMNRMPHLKNFEKDTNENLTKVFIEASIRNAY